MKYSDTNWKAAIVKAIADLKTERYTQGRVCATASVRVIRDGVCADFKETWKKGDSLEDCLTILRDSFNELLGEVSKEAKDGFASNASAAAKAAGYKSEAETATGLTE